jgi:hypothetical protein
MALLTKKRYTVVGEFSLKDEHGLIHHLVGGDELPQELQALLSEAEVNTHVNSGMFRPIGWTPPPRQPEVSPKPPTPEEILSNLGLPTGGPRGVELRQLDRPPTPKELEACAAASGPAVVLVHRLPDGTAVATVNLGRLLALYASMPGAR